ncbi:TPA: beta-glucosidase [Candidatus Bathyarchaeota archaeon]|nr:beta-glucosidase [Candidatus Bathyarchaeota archaeon]
MKTKILKIKGETRVVDVIPNIETKVKNLLKNMTLEEKVAQLGSIRGRSLLEDGKFSRRKAEQLLKNGIGQITRVSGGARDVTDPKQAALIANEIQRFLKEETRLGIPAIIHEECLSGFMAYGATTFPQAIGLASTWTPNLIERVTATIRRQMRAVGVHQGLSPVLDVARDPRWGRNEETFGEDPYLVAVMGVAYVKGLQGSNLREGIIATPKHFAAHGFSEGGRNRASVHVPPREFREVYLFPFEAAVKEANAWSIMNAYHDIDGVPCAASRRLLTEILRGEWGFRGYVVSDYSSIKMLYTFHHVAIDEEEAAVQALEAGIDVELPEIDCYGEPLLKAVREEKISMAVIDEAVSRILRAKFLLGLFENPYVNVKDASISFDTSEDRRLALEAARESLVLLKNNGVLPLKKDIKAIAVIGPNADNARNLHGDYSYTAHLRCDEPAVPTVTILMSIKNKVSEETSIYYARGCGISDASKDGFKEALAAAEKSDVIVAVVGERSGLSNDDVSGEHRDRADLRLPGVQEELIEMLCETGKSVVVVLVNGRPLSLKRIVDKCSAILEAWLPGEEGGNAVADVLFGDYNPGGKLPVSFPQHVGQIPVNYGRRHSSFGDYVFSSSKPLFPFGHGLSYTNFEYSSLSISPEKIGPAGRVEIAFDVKNIGDRKGDEVVQLYIQDEVSSVTRPAMELKGFKRVMLEPGEKKRITFRLSVDQLAFYDRHMRFVVEPGTFKVMIGGSSEDICLSGRFEVIGDAKVTPSTRVFFSEVNIS